MVLEETGAIFGNDTSRVDLLLVPVASGAHCMSRTGDFFTDRPAVVGIEVKTNRADFLRGLREEQFTRYAAYMHGLYVLTYKDVCKTAEVPPGVGHLVAYYRDRGRGLAITCRRHPKYNSLELSSNVMWRLLWAVREHERAARQKEHSFRSDYKQRMGRMIGGRIMTLIQRLESEFDDEPGWCKRGQQEGV